MEALKLTYEHARVCTLLREEHAFSAQLSLINRTEFSFLFSPI